MFGLSFLPAAEACCVDPSSSLLLSGTLKSELEK